jgi:type VI secretion system protein ImpG
MADEAEDQLYGAYLGELDYLHTAGAAFAARHPQVARRLVLEEHGSADPQVERLLESFAFLTARLQHQIDSEFPEIPAALMGVLYPHLVAPVPSCAIAAFHPDPEQSRALMGVSVKPGTALLAPGAGKDSATLRFRTCGPLTLWPIEVTGCELHSPAKYDFLHGHDVATVLHLRLECLGTRNFAEFHPPALRFYLHGAHGVATTLYRLLLDACAGIAVLPQDHERPSAWLPASAVRPTGFGDDEAALPHPENAHQGYRWLQEFACFPEKFRFVELQDLDGLGRGRAVDLLFLLRERPAGALRLQPGTVRLNCVPMVNLFRHVSEPVRLDHLKSEYRLVPDSRWERSTEIHSITRVSATAAHEDGTRVFHPYFSATHALRPGEVPAFWIARRRRAERADLDGTDLVLSFKDLAFAPTQPATQVVFAHLLCTNRGQAAHIPPGTRLEIEEDTPVQAITCLTRPSRQIDPPTGGDTLWRLVSHLSLNHLSLDDGPDSLAALKEILRLYGGVDSQAWERQLSGLTDMAVRRTVLRVGDDAWRGFYRGVEVTLTVDEDLVELGAAYALGTVLSHFLGLYAAVNSFTRLVMTSLQRKGMRLTWPPMTDRTVIRPSDGCS